MTSYGGPVQKDKKLRQRDWSKKTKVWRNTEDTIHWFRMAYLFLSRGYKGYQPQHGPHKPYFTLEHYILSERAIKKQRRRAAGIQAHRAIRNWFQTGVLQERADWELVREALMWQALQHKFGVGTTITEDGINLLNTYPKITKIIEANIACENFWGACVCPNCNGQRGRNIYGEMLLSMRDQLIGAR